jgi:hypothetical protein
LCLRFGSLRIWRRYFLFLLLFCWSIRCGVHINVEMHILVRNFLVYKAFFKSAKCKRTMSWIVLTSSRRRWGFQSVDILNLWFTLSQLLLVYSRVLVPCLDGLITCSNILVISLELKYSANTGKLLQRFSDLTSKSVVSSALMMPLSPKRVDIISQRWSL